MADEAANSTNARPELDAVVAAYIEAVEAGEPPNHEQWLERYPQFAAQLEEFFDAERGIAQLVRGPGLATTEPFVPGSRQSPARSAVQEPGEHPSLRPREGISFKVRQGTILAGRYRVFAVKSGGMGYVYLADVVGAQDDFAGRKVAIKTVPDFDEWRKMRRRDRKPADRSAYRDLLSRFRREASSWVRLGKHINIIWAWWVADIRGKPYLLMDYGDSGDLGTWIAERRLDVPLTVNFAIQFCEGMIYAVKTANVVHRDIKPRNVIIHDRRILKIADFGLARAHFPDSDELTGSIAESPDRSLSSAGGGTLAYMAPEQFRSLAVADTRSDVFSFGAMLYEMSTSTRLFRPGTASQQLALRGRPVPEAHMVNPAVPPELSALISRCVAYDPADRYQTFEDVRAALWDVYGQYSGRSPVPCGRSTIPREMDAVRQTYSLLSLGEYHEVIEIASLALQESPGQVELLTNKGVAHLKLAQLHDAEDCLDHAARMAPSNTLVWCNMSIVKSELGYPITALQAAQRAIKLDPTLFDGWFALGRCCEAQGQWESASDAYARAIEISGDNWAAHLKYGESLWNLGRLEEALASVRRAANINPEAFEPWGFLAGCLSELNRNEEALEAVERCLEINPSSSACWAARGFLLWQSRCDRAGVCACYQKALRLDPGNVRARSLLSSLE